MSCVNVVSKNNYQAIIKIHFHDINVGETTHNFCCHSGRVKRLAVAPNVPFMFWSAAEDGAIM